MKKNILISLFCIGLGAYFGFIMFTSYKSKTKIETSLVSKIDKTYFLQIGAYSDLNNMKNNLNNLEYYIYTKENNLYYVFIAITKNKQNVNKLKEHFKNKGYDIYVKEINVNNEQFYEILNQYDNMLKETTDEKTIDAICSQIISKYEELVINEGKGDSSK